MLVSLAIVAPARQVPRGHPRRLVLAGLPCMPAAAVPESPAAMDFLRHSLLARDTGAPNLLITARLQVPCLAALCLDPAVPAPSRPCRDVPKTHLRRRSSPSTASFFFLERE